MYKRCQCRGAACRHPFHARFKFNGMLYRLSTKTANRRLAEQIQAKVREDLVAKHFGVMR